ncbi:glycosyltransferase family 2 protein [bacterium]|nr:glycosyltransferase family 2 protein [bacterium]
MDIQDISVVIPAYNEQSAIYNVITDVKKILDKSNIKGEIIVVDDGSSDKTSISAKQAGAKVLSNNRNLGYGASLKKGIFFAKNDCIVIIDADGTYPADKIPEFIETLKTADMVVGARTGKNVNMPFLRKLPKLMLRKFAGYLTGETIPDLNSGLRAFRRSLVESYINILPDKFSFTTTITVALLYDNYNVVYIPIDYLKRKDSSKIVPWNFFEFIILILRLSMLFNPLKIFLPLAFWSFFIGCVKFVFDFMFVYKQAGGFTFDLLTQKVISSTTIILWLAGLQIALIGMVADALIRKIGGKKSYRRIDGD